MAIRSMVLAAGAAALVTAQGAYAAPVKSPVAFDPLVSLSLLGTAQSRAAVCAAGSAAVAAGAVSAAQAVSPAPGCVLPVVGPAPAPPPPVTTSTYIPPAAVDGPGIGLLPLILGGAVLAGLVWYFLLRDDDDDDDIPVPPPISP